MCAFNQSEGGVPEFIDFWNMIVRMGAIVEAISLRILAGILNVGGTPGKYGICYSLVLLANST